MKRKSFWEQTKEEILCVKRLKRIINLNSCCDPSVLKTPRHKPVTVGAQPSKDRGRMTAPKPLEALGRVLAEVSAATQQQMEATMQQMQVLQALVSQSRGKEKGKGTAMQRMAEGKDPQVFLDVFETTATACGWPDTEWGVKLLPLLAGKAQRAALSLPVHARVHFPNLRRAILDRIGSHPEDHRRRFRAMRLGPEDRPFVLAQQLRDAAVRWLEPQEADSKMLERILLEQFVEAITAQTAAWVRYHRPQDLMAAVALAEDHLAVYREGSAKTAERPTPAPRAADRSRAAPRAAERPIPAPRRRSWQTQEAASPDKDMRTHTHTRTHNIILQHY
ncbi:uncharacterized protein LOC133550635 [Nerophis ophidion]|uniref:uncharacterized protein LOC133550635 n=1 Tax=Nerophis ophidion TaxID=159077 RepID=UPI002ADF8A11|nr:uncharacterized protein LOC133550635 [Nerophis ophidion]